MIPQFYITFYALKRANNPKENGKRRNEVTDMDKNYHRKGESIKKNNQQEIGY